MRARWDVPIPPGLWRAGVIDAHLRASDVERSEVADRLARHFADGRLDEAEFRRRLDIAMGATTRGDLAGLFDDLPALAAPPPPPVPRRQRVVPLLLLVLLAVVIVGSAVTVVHRAFFVVVVLIGLYLWHRARSHHRSHHADDRGGHPGLDR